MHDFKKLRVWKVAFDLAVQIHKTTAPIQKIDRDLVRQTRRSASSISANIAEGSGRYTNADQAYAEIPAIKDLFDQLIVVRKMLNKLIRFKRK